MIVDPLPSPLQPIALRGMTLLSRLGPRWTVEHTPASAPHLLLTNARTGARESVAWLDIRQGLIDGILTVENV